MRPRLFKALFFSVSAKINKAFSVHRCMYILFFFYVLLGIFGRFPWKADEPYFFDISWNMVIHNAWLVPHVGDFPFMEKPPFMAWIGAFFIKILPFLPAHESSRFAVVLCICITVWAFLLASRCLHEEMSCKKCGPNLTTMPILANWQMNALCLLVGTLGFVEHIHKFTADLGQLAGAMMALSALILVASPTSEKRPSYYGSLFGSGIGVAFLSKGLFILCILGLSVCIFLVVFSDFRHRLSLKFSFFATLTASPFLLIWPWLIYRTHPNLFNEWFWVNNIGRFSGSARLGGNDVTYVDKFVSILFNGAPTSLFLLAGLALLLFRLLRSWSCKLKTTQEKNSIYPAIKTRGYYVAIVFLITGLCTLFVSASMRDLYLLPILPAMILVALPFLHLMESINLKWQKGLNIFFFMMLLIILMTWINLGYNGEATLLGLIWHNVSDVLPLPFVLHTNGMLVALVCFLIICWCRVVRQNDKNIIRSWGCGLAILWSTTALLLIPWIDASRSYEQTFLSMNSVMANHNGCLITEGLGESEIGMLHYVTSKAGISMTFFEKKYSNITENSTLDLFENRSESCELDSPEAATRPPGWCTKADRDGKHTRLSGKVKENLQPSADFLTSALLPRCAFLLVLDEIKFPQKNISPIWTPIWSGGRLTDEKGFTLYYKGL